MPLPTKSQNTSLVDYGGLRFFDSWMFLDSSLNNALKLSTNDFFKTTKWKIVFLIFFSLKKLTSSYVIFKKSECHDKPISEIKKEKATQIKQRNASCWIYRSNKHKSREKNLKTDRYLFVRYNKSDVTIIADMFENYVETWYEEVEPKKFCFLSLPGYTLDAGSNTQKLSGKISEKQIYSQFLRMKSGVEYLDVWVNDMQLLWMIWDYSL